MYTLARTGIDVDDFAVGIHHDLNIHTMVSFPIDELLLMFPRSDDLHVGCHQYPRKVGPHQDSKLCLLLLLIASSFGKWDELWQSSRQRITDLHNDPTQGCLRQMQYVAICPLKTSCREEMQCSANLVYGSYWVVPISLRGDVIMKKGLNPFNSLSRKTRYLWMSSSSLYFCSG